MARPADTIAKIGDYIWWLLPSFLKRQARNLSLIGVYCDSFGEALDEARNTLESVVPLSLVETSEGEYLKRLGHMRQTDYIEGENEEVYRQRVFDAWEDKQLQGSIPGLKTSLALLGYETVIWEYRVVSRSLYLPPENAQEREAYIVAEATPGRWDDGGFFDDGGYYDDWIIAEAEWAGHEGELTMWLDGEWKFLRPWVGMIVKVCDENEPNGRLYRFDGLGWVYREAGSQWSHFAVQVINAEEDARAQADFLRILRVQRPAHTRPVIVSELEAGTWDDNGYSDDDGLIDDWIL